MKKKQRERRRNHGPSRPHTAAPQPQNSRHPSRWRPAVGGVIVLCAATLVVSAFAARRARNAAIAASHSTSNGPSTAPAACCSQFPSRFGLTTQPSDAPAGMVWIPGGEFSMGGAGDDPRARPDEGPVHRVRVDGFWIDPTPVTNAEFRHFVEATGYVTTAEKKPDWEEIKKQVPPGTPKPPDDKLVAASLVFKPTPGPVPLQDFSQWWDWKPGADWRHPEGPGSNIDGKDDHPVVHVSWDDAVAYCKWAGKRLPTEAEFEYAARGGLEGKKYPWGDEHVSDEHPQCNFWQGQFPYLNAGTDGYPRTSPVKAFKPNGYGLYDMAGNVWEWCGDWYRPDTYQQYAGKGVVTNPQGPDQSYDPEEPFTPKRVTRGGSFLCNDSYCSSYRAAARMKCSPDSSTNHTGFRCVVTPPMWEARQGQKAKGAS